jgi:hypothetical protein
MENPTAETVIRPPKIIASLSQGFNLVATNIRLILLPLLLDFFLWLGPHLSVKELARGFVEGTFAQLPTDVPNLTDITTLIKSFWDSVGDINLLAGLRTLPIGVPSLMAGAGFSTNPFGNSIIYPVTSLQSALLAYLALFITGLLVGTLFFNNLAKIARAEKQKTTFRLIGWQALQCLLLTLALVIIIMILFIPVSIFSQFISVISPGLIQVAFFVIGIFIIWLLLPLIFSAHGIFVEHRGAFESILLSIRLIRYYLPGTGMFILLTLVISQALNMLWLLPPGDSWFLVLGIGGHAFIVTSLITATFVYYQGGLKWMREMLRRTSAVKKNVA